MQGGSVSKAPAEVPCKPINELHINELPDALLLEVSGRCPAWAGKSGLLRVQSHPTARAVPVGFLRGHKQPV